MFDDGQEHTLQHVDCRCVADGPVFARLEIQGAIDQIRVVTWVTVYAELDRIDFDVRIHKPVNSQQQRLCQLFPVLAHAGHAADRCGRSRRAGSGDNPREISCRVRTLRRFAVQEFVNFSNDAVDVTLVPRDAFCLRLDLDVPAFEAFGNDQNYKEVSKDQDGVTDFCFRYSLVREAWRL